MAVSDADADDRCIQPMRSVKAQQQGPDRIPSYYERARHAGNALQCNTGPLQVLPVYVTTPLPVRHSLSGPSNVTRMHSALLPNARLALTRSNPAFCVRPSVRPLGGMGQIGGW